MSSVDGHPGGGVTEGMAGRFLDAVLHILRVDAVALLSERRGSVVATVDATLSEFPWQSEWAVLGAVADHDSGPGEPVTPRMVGNSLVASLPVCVDGQVVASLHLRVKPGWTTNLWSAALIRMLARSAAQLFDADGALVENLTDDAAMLRSAKWLVDLAEMHHYEQLVGGITALVAPLVSAGSLGIAMINPGGYLQMLPGSFGAPASLVASSQLSRNEENSAAAEVFNHGRTMLANVPSRDATRFPEWFASFGIRRLMTVPLIASGRPIGVLHLANKTTDFRDEDARRVEAIAPFVAGVVKHARQRRDIHRREAIAAVVSRAATAVAAGDRLEVVSGDEGLALHLDSLRVVLGATSAALVPDGGALPATHVGAPVDDSPGCRALFEGLQGSVTVRSSVRRPQAPGEEGWTTLYVPVVVEGRPKATLAMLRIPCEPWRRYERAAVVELSNLLALSWTTQEYRRREDEVTRLRERERIADDIHDHVAQTLFSTKITLQSLVEDIPDGTQVREGFDRALGMLARSEASLREAIYNLAAHADRGGPHIADRLVDTVHELEEQFDVSVELSANGASLDVAERLPNPVAAAVVAATREAVVNAAKHARSTRITVSLDADADGVMVVVTDDGMGLASSRPGYGLTSMRRKLTAQGAAVSMRAREGGGTEVCISAPLHPGREH